MSGELLQTLSVDELVQRFAAVALKQHDPLEYDDAEAYNLLVPEAQAIEDELKRRGAAEFCCLDRLLSHPNITVRLEAARSLIRVIPDKVRPVLERIQRTGHLPHAGDAGMLLDPFVFDSDKKK